ncbi:hypothetical protein NHX12_028745 [Muraenolepis orangiensis]|uniref:Uncharacterized protein n=1 Tax=Muraenolepis orangiensis TaxID=630683 RepID=A0A9Q0ECD6_9TELE|nr:hypothetical protein NHX12_028745 [Muraenolepis orangiensis]
MNDLGEVNSTMFLSDNLANVTRLTTKGKVAGMAPGPRNLQTLILEENALTQIEPAWFSPPNSTPSPHPQRAQPHRPGVCGSVEERADPGSRLRSWLAGNLWAQDFLKDLKGRALLEHENQEEAEELLRPDLRQKAIRVWSDPVVHSTPKKDAIETVDWHTESLEY